MPNAKPAGHLTDGLPGLLYCPACGEQTLTLRTANGIGQHYSCPCGYRVRIRGGLPEWPRGTYRVREEEMGGEAIYAPGPRELQRRVALMRQLHVAVLQRLGHAQMRSHAAWHWKDPTPQLGERLGRMAERPCRVLTPAQPA